MMFYDEEVLSSNKNLDFLHMTLLKVGQGYSSRDYRVVLLCVSSFQ